jgi:hypothetical protein
MFSFIFGSVALCTKRAGIKKERYDVVNISPFLTKTKEYEHRLL